MKIDYASYTFVPPPRKPNLRRTGLFLSIFILIIMIALCGWLYVKVSGSENVQHISSRLKSIFSHNKPTTANKVTPEAAEQTQPVQFNFYSELPNMHVTTTSQVPTEKKPIPQAAPLQATEQKYILQLGTFNDLSNASQHRLSLLLLGLETQVVQIKVNGEKIYRVQQGPYITSADAKTAQKKLLKKGIEATIKEG